MHFSWPDSTEYLASLRKEREGMMPEEFRRLYQQDVIVGLDLASGPDMTVRWNKKVGCYERKIGLHGRWERVS